MYICMKREREEKKKEIYFKELAYPIMQAGKFKIYRMGQQAENLRN